LFNDAGWGVITEGCKTTHGGTVLPVSRTFTDLVGGASRSVAMVGDMTHCPKCRGNFPIVEGDPRRTWNGLQMAFHGHKTACGATLISEHGVKSAVSPSKAVPASASAAIQQVFTRYDQFFLVVDEATGTPVTCFNYGLKTTAGEHHDLLYSDGATVKAYSEEPKNVELLYLVQTEIGVRA
jgi:uncharacterized Zn-binding protein involved in type VI secretion